MPDNVLNNNEIKAATKAFYSSGFIVLLLVFTSCFQPKFAHGNNDNLRDPEKTRKELKTLNKKISKLQKSQNKNINKRDKTQKKLKKTELQISEISKKTAKIAQQLAESQKQIGTLSSRHTQLSDNKKQQQGALISDIRASYTTGKQEYLKLLLSQQDPQTVARHIRYYEYVQKARINRINEYNQTLTDLKNTTLALEKEAQLLATLKTQLNQQKSDLNQAQEQRATALAKLSTTITNQKQQLIEWQSSQKHLEKILDAVQNTLSDLPANIGEIAFAQRKGKMYWPVQGKISHNFGNQRAQGRLKWNGVLIKAPIGRSVYAIHGGRVVFSDWIRSYGLLMILDHGNGYLSLYGHNQSLYKETGDWVAAGEKIASIGNSGGLTSPGLYFEIRTGEKPINPKHWCIARR